VPAQIHRCSLGAWHLRLGTYVCGSVKRVASAVGEGSVVISKGLGIHRKKPPEGTHRNDSKSEQ
jgi:hypothetical protein